jgi:hypothetical protein
MLIRVSIRSKYNITSRRPFQHVGFEICRQMLDLADGGNTALSANRWPPALFAAMKYNISLLHEQQLQPGAAS